LSKNLSAEFEKDFLLLIFAIFDSFIWLIFTNKFATQCKLSWSHNLMRIDNLEAKIYLTEASKKNWVSEL
jgi:hypothetical protein